jgi:aminoglycoside phosphotransferase (APT) family kinase protein
MAFRPIERGPRTFQQPVTEDEIQAVCQRALGSSASVTSAVELATGMYNNTYRVTVTGQERPMILRFAPAPDRQFRSERELMRNEYASLPYLAVIAPLMPQVIAVDWSHEVIGRDWMILSLLDGVPAPDRLSAYPRTMWPRFFGQIGVIARQVHSVRGPHFGPVAGPAYRAWSDAVLASLEDIALDLDGVGLDSADLRQVVAVVAKDRRRLDEITKPRLLSGDLWTANTLLDAASPEPVITGVLDFDRTWFGDPLADWTLRMAAAKNDERRAFWDSYGTRDRSPEAIWRSQVYEARHLGALRLERYRLGNVEAVRDSYQAMSRVLALVS